MPHMRILMRNKQSQRNSILPRPLNVLNEHVSTRRPPFAGCANLASKTAATRSRGPLLQHEFLERHVIHIRIWLVLLDDTLLVQIVEIVVVLVVGLVVHVALNRDTRCNRCVLQLVRLIQCWADPHDVPLDEIGPQKGRSLLGKIRIQIDVYLTL